MFLSLSAQGGMELPYKGGARKDLLNHHAGVDEQAVVELNPALAFISLQMPVFRTGIVQLETIGQDQGVHE